MFSLIKVASIQVSEASRVFGDYIEKQAFTLDVNPVNVAASVAGGYAANRTYHRIQDKKEQELASRQTLENDHYANIQNILKNMKVVFTPINVIFYVNNQVFEIIKTNEMSDVMRQKFIAKDAEFFKNLVINKMNMELQLAEQIFARSLLSSHIPEGQKTAFFSREWFEKLANHEEEVFSHVKEMEKKASAPIQFKLNFDSLRPFDTSVDFQTVEKVASIKDYFTSGLSEVLTQGDLNNSVKVGFLPDRVIFTLNGQLLDQISVLHMNEEGYAAFKRRDKEFFYNFFKEEAKRIEAAVVKRTADDFINKQASVEEGNDEDFDHFMISLAEDFELDEETEKVSASLEEMTSDWVETLSIERSNLELFKDHDIHPIVYDWVLDKHFGPTWHEDELESIVKQLEIDFELSGGIGSIPLDKIAMLHTVQNEKHSVYSTEFSFEKFVRTMNSKTTDVEMMEYGIEFEELLFAFDLAKSLSDDDVFLEFGHSVVSYVAKVLFDDDIRFVSDQLYDEENLGESDFFDEVNGLLTRLWQDRDSQGLSGNESAFVRERTKRINRYTEEILRNHADELNPKDPYGSAESVASNVFSFDDVAELNVVSTQVARHVIGTLFIELKRQEAQTTLESVESEG